MAHNAATPRKKAIVKATPSTRKKPLQPAQVQQRNMAVLEQLRNLPGLVVRLEGKSGKWLKLNMLGTLPAFVARLAERAGYPITPTQARNVARWLLVKGYRTAQKHGNHYDHYIKVEEPDDKPVGGEQQGMAAATAAHVAV